MANSASLVLGVSFVFSTSVWLFGSGTNIVGSGRNIRTSLTCGYRVSVEITLISLFTGSMVFALCLFLLKSRMNREVQVRFCERFGGASPPYLLDFIIQSR